MILEGIVTTLDPDRRARVSPMGPRVTESMDTLVLRPFKTSNTYRNLRRQGEGVFHVTDDAGLIARAAVSDVEPRLVRAARVDGWRLADACRAYEFTVHRVDDREERTVLECEVVHRERLRDFLGFCRARHAVIEAAILATRTGLIAPDEILRRFDELDVIVEKTGEAPEHRAMEGLRRHVDAERARLGAGPAGGDAVR